jgi:P27 family predicted phage terminase small subunit
MGRPNKPTADHAARGNPGKRARNRQEPDPEYLDDMTPPTWLSEAARKVWTECAPKMRKAKVLTVLDVEPFSRWCVLVVRYRAVVADLERLGVMVGPSEDSAKSAPAKDAAATKDATPAKPARQVVINQLVFVESMLQKQLLAIEREFGMTPAARTRVQVEPQLTLFGKNDGDSAEHGKPPQAKGSAYFTGSAPH